MPNILQARRVITRPKGTISPLLNGLVAHWKLEEASGTRFDSHTNGYNLTDNNTVGSAAGKLGTAANLIAANSEYLSISDAAGPALRGGNFDFTFGCWVKLAVTTGSRTPLSKWHWGLNQREYALWYDGASARFKFYVSSNGTDTNFVTATTFGAPSAGVWYWLMAGHDAAGDVIFIQVNNGTYETVAHATGIFASTDSFKIGQYTSQDYWDGDIDSVSRWDRLLTSGEKAALYGSGNGLDYPF